MSELLTIKCPFPNVVLSEGRVLSALDYNADIAALR